MWQTRTVGTREQRSKLYSQAANKQAAITMKKPKTEPTGKNRPKKPNRRKKPKPTQR